VRFLGSRAGFVLGLAVGVVMAAGLALAQEGETTAVAQVEADETDSPPWLEYYPDWTSDTPGPPPWAPGPPPWAGAEDGDRPPRLDHPDWQPGTRGPPPWAGAEDSD
jgi:hypothetical protein